MKLSIITVCLNNRTTIRDTINSVLSQSSVELEYLIIDGGSDDGTLDIIESYRQQLSLLVSEPDTGMYDAMNKGISRAKGEVIGILNADDAYAHDHVLAKVSEAFKDPAIAACYGDLMYTCHADASRIRRFWKAGPYDRRRFYRGWMPPHPTFFVRKNCYERFGAYRTDLGSSADYELMLRYLLCHNVKPAYISEVLVLMRTGGTSNATLGNRLQAHLMDWKAWRVNALRPYLWTLPMKPLSKIAQWFVRN